MSNMAELARLIQLANHLSNVDEAERERLVHQHQQQLLQSIHRDNLIRPRPIRPTRPTRPQPQPLLDFAAIRPNLLGGGVGRTHRNHLNNNNNVYRHPGIFFEDPPVGPANLPQHQPQHQHHQPTTRIPAGLNAFLSMQCPHCNHIQSSRNFYCSQITCRELMYVTSNGRCEKCPNCNFPRSSLNTNACPLCFSIYNEIGVISLPAPVRPASQTVSTSTGNHEHEQAPGPVLEEIEGDV